MLENKFIHINEGSELSWNGFEYPEKSERFCWEYLEEHKLNFKDIQLIQKTADRFRKLNIFNSEFIQCKTLFQSNVTVDDIFLNVYSYLPIKRGTKRRYECNYIDFDFVFPYKFSSAYSEVNSEDELEEITYTIQINNTYQVFIGYLTYSEDLYSTVIIDARYQILCQIINDNKLLHRYIDQFIMIKKYQYILEYYKEDSTKLEYLLFSIDDVDVLNLERKIIDTKGYSSSNNCIVLHKCPVYYHNFKRKYEIWLYVEFPKNNLKCLISSAHFLNIYHLINVGTELKINIPEDVDLKEYFKFQ